MFEVFDSVINLKYYLKETLLIFICVFISVRYLSYLWGKRYLYIKSWTIPGPLALPFIGAGYLFLRNPTQYMKLMRGLQEKYKGIFKFWLGPKLIFVITKPEHVEKVLFSPSAIEKHPLYYTLNEFLGPGLVTGPASIWKGHRKAILPSFNKNILDSYVSIFAESSLTFVKVLKELAGKKDIDWAILAKRYALDTACKTTMGLDLNILNGEQRTEDLGDCIQNLNELITARIAIIWNHVKILYRFSKTKKEFDKYNKLFDKITTAAVTEKIKKINEEKEKDFHYEESDGKTKRVGFLEQLLVQDKIFTHQPMMDEVKTILGGATDTIGVTLCGLFILLGMHQDVQQKVYEEVIDVIHFKREVEVSDLLKLKYTETAIKESLRLFPPVVVIGRLFTADLKIGDVTAPKGSTCILIPSLTHRNPEYWEDPLTFKPERFLPGEVNKRHPCSFIPFSHGPRNCIGYYYAYQSVKTFIATVVRDFKIFTTYKSVEEVEFKLQPVLTFTKGVNVWFEARK